MTIPETRFDPDPLMEYLPGHRSDRGEWRARVRRGGPDAGDPGRRGGEAPSPEARGTRCGFLVDRSIRPRSFHPPPSMIETPPLARKSPTPMHCLRIAAPILVLIPILVGGCADDPQPDPEVVTVQAPEPVPAETVEQVRTRGAAAAGALAQGLVGRLTAAIDERGVAGAVDFCASEALVLTREVISAHDPELEIKRTTTRWRNPENAPDPEEARVLRHLEALEAAERGSAPETFTAMGPDGTYRFYRTLRAAPMCLRCHGSVEEMDPEVRAMISERYPEDRATGYGDGDFRGVIRVQIPGPGADR